jgi:hypothetical protein
MLMPTPSVIDPAMDVLVTTRTHRRHYRIHEWGIRWRAGLEIDREMEIDVICLKSEARRIKQVWLREIEHFVHQGWNLTPRNRRDT